MAPTDAPLEAPPAKAKEETWWANCAFVIAVHVVALAALAAYEPRSRWIYALVPAFWWPAMFGAPAYYAPPAHASRSHAQPVLLLPLRRDQRRLPPPLEPPRVLGEPALPRRPRALRHQRPPGVDQVVGCVSALDPIRARAWGFWDSHAGRLRSPTHSGAPPAAPPLHGLGERPVQQQARLLLFAHWVDLYQAPLRQTVADRHARPRQRQRFGRAGHEHDALRPVSLTFLPPTPPSSHAC